MSQENVEIVRRVVDSWNRRDEEELVPTATSNTSRSSTTGDDGDARDAQGRIYVSFGSAGGLTVSA